MGEQDREGQKIEEQKRETKKSLFAREISEGVETKELKKVNDQMVEIYFRKYGEDDEEYLVDGAILTCDMATMDSWVNDGIEFTPSEGMREDLVKVQREVVEKIDKQTFLTVLGKPNSINDAQIATVKAHQVIDEEKGNIGNIRPFHCNCKRGPNNDEETKKLMDNVEKYQNQGTCGAFMRLDDDWENAIKNTNYFRYEHTYENGETEEADGVTMAAMLFCSHGGFITPVKSGQSDEKKRNINKFVNAALEEARKGVKEEVVNGKGTNKVIYNNWFYSKTVSASNGKSYAWCAVFVSWCADRAGILGDLVPCECACINVKKYYVDEGRYHEAGNYNPQVGDVFVHLNDDSTGHVGIVAAYDVDTKKIYTIEGNSNDQVAIRERAYDVDYFDGFGSNGGIGYGTIPEEYETGDARDR